MACAAREDILSVVHGMADVPMHERDRAAMRLIGARSGVVHLRPNEAENRLTRFVRHPLYSLLHPFSLLMAANTESSTTANIEIMADSTVEDQWAQAPILTREHQPWQRWAEYGRTEVLLKVISEEPSSRDGNDTHDSEDMNVGSKLVVCIRTPLDGTSANCEEYDVSSSMDV